MTKTELSRARYLSREIINLMQELTELKIERRRAEEWRSDEFAAREERLAAKIAKMRAEQQRIEEFLDGVEDCFVRQILTLRYVRCQSWAAVAAAMGGGNSVSAVRMAATRYLERYGGEAHESRTRCVL